jgi:hypothetical protein
LAALMASPYEAGAEPCASCCCVSSWQRYCSLPPPLAQGLAPGLAPGLIRVPRGCLDLHGALEPRAK